MAPRQLHMITREELNVERWDGCIASHANGLIYSQSMYLDAMSENWNAIVSDNYDIVCALPWKMKYGIRYVYPPPYVQQSGLIGTDINQTDISSALKLMKSFCRYGEYYFNFANTLSGSPRQNFVLDLNKPYNPVAYPADFRYDLKKATAAGLQYRTSTDYKAAVQMYHHHLQQKKDTGSGLLHKLLILADVYAVHDSLVMRETIDEKGKVLSCVLCFRDNKRIYLLLSATTVEGRKVRANHFLMDNLFRELTPSPLLFDFVGSDIPGIAHYYRNFTGTTEPYYQVKWNNLPIPIRWLKR